MDYLLNNRVAELILKDGYSTGVFIALITIVVMLFFFYNIIYDKAKSSHFAQIGKTALVSSMLACGIIYMSKEKGIKTEKGCSYDDI